MKHLLYLPSALLILWACSEGMPTAEGPGSWERPQLLPTPPGKCLIAPLPDQGNATTCSASATATPSNYLCGLSCAFPQVDPVHYVFSKPVYGVVVDGYGSWYCNSVDQGTIRLYSHGVMVETGYPTIIDQVGQCSGPPGTYLDDSLAGEVVYYSTYQGPIDSIIIEKQQPESLVLYWPPFHNEVENTNSIANIYASYSFFVNETRPPTATACLTNDELLDQQSLRDMLHALWADSSGVFGPPALKREVPIVIFEDSLTGAIGFRRTLSAPTDTPCSGNLAPNTQDLPGRVVGTGHLHPFSRHRASLPIECFPTAPPGFQPGGYDDSTFAGASVRDLREIANNPVPMYVVDSMHIHIVPTDATPVNAESRVRTLRRYNALNLCTIL